MKTLNTQVLIERLIQHMDLHRIFLFSYPFLEEEQYHLLLIVNPVKGLSPKAMAPIVSLCMSDTDEIPFDMMLAGEWQNQLKQGSLYYTYASLPQHERFAASKKKSPLLSHKTIAGLLELAQLNYDKCRQGSDEFREAANSFVAKGDYGQAAFMLHQYLEVRLKGFQATAGINGGKSHNLEHLMKSLRGVAPALLSIFPYDSPSVELFRLLDQSYVKGKKMETLEIREEEFHILLEKCQHACTALDGMVASMVERIAAYQEQLADAVAGKEDDKDAQQVTKVIVNTTPSSQLICADFSSFPWPEHYRQDVNALLDDIYQKHRPEEILLLNYHTRGFSGGNLFQQREEDEKRGGKVELYLVALMKNKGPFHFKCKKQGTASAMVLFLNVDYVKKKLADGDRFVQTLWTKGLMLCRKSTFEPSFSVGAVNWKREHDLTETIWENAKACMQNLNSVIHNTPAPMQDTALLLLRNLLEIGVQTYFQCTVGYVPKDLHMAELVDWSGIAGRQLVNFIYPNSEMEEAYMQMVMNPKIIWWHNLEVALPKASPAFSREKAEEMVSFFEGLCDAALQELAVKAGKAEQAETSV